MLDDAIARVTPQEAFKILTEDSTAVLVDVRSKVEFDYVGHPVNAIHVPWKEFPNWKKNPNFVQHFQAAIGEASPSDDARPILTICRSGGRSLAAARVLVEAGYKRLYNVEEGFEGDKDSDDHRGTINGWRFHALPWVQT